MLKRTHLDSSYNLQAAEAFLSRVEKVISQRTDPKLISQILIEFKLESINFSDKDFAVFIQKIKTEPMDATEFLKKLKSSILENKPLCKLLGNIHILQLISDEELEAAAGTFQLQINLLFLLEAFNITMANSTTLAKEIYQFMSNQRASFQPNNQLVNFIWGSFQPGNPVANFLFGAPKQATLFERLKMISVDPAMTNVAFHKSTADKEETKEDVETFISEFQLRGINASISPGVIGKPSDTSARGLCLNILEAAWEDATHEASKKGGIDNAIAGFGLITIMEHLQDVSAQQYINRLKLVPAILPEGIQLNEDHSYPLMPDLIVNTQLKKVDELVMHKVWRDLYNTWNAYFVVANLDAILLPLKLLLPSVLKAEANYFKESRVMSLFLVGSLFFNNQTKHNPLFQSKFSFKQADEILSLWGKINREYAEQLLKEYCPDVKKTAADLYKETFGNHATVNLIKHVVSFGRNPSDFHITCYGTGSKIKNLTFFSPDERKTKMEFACSKSDKQFEKKSVI